MISRRIVCTGGRVGGGGGEGEGDDARDKVSDPDSEDGIVSL